MIIGIICSYTDIRYNKIFNKWILSGLFSAIILYLYLIFYENALPYVVSLVTNGVIAFFVGYLLWHLKLWSAGDAKLFTIFALLIPFTFYSKSYIAYFPSFNLMVNLFIPLLIILAVSAAIGAIKEVFVLREKLLKRIEIPNLKKTFDLIGKLFEMFLGYLFVIIIMRVVITTFEEIPAAQTLSNPFFIFAIMLLAMGKFQKERKKNKYLNLLIYGTIAIYISILIAMGLNFLIINLLKGALIFMILIGFTRRILDFYVRKKQILRIPPENVKEGMVPVGEKNLLILQKISEDESLGVCDAGGFSKEQAEKINSISEKFEKYFRIEIYKTLPFAPFMLLAALISIWTQSSFVNIIREIFDFLIITM